MSKQLFELGEKVCVFKMQNDQPTRACGTITTAEINSGGYIQYTIQTENGPFLANHASVARTDKELDIKIKKYIEYITAQKKIFEEKFGKPEFEKGVSDGK